ncbi:hypothetical protein OPT61_g41 [Boeremia exigua]|uniref:Uncharacterized protein n=1 Tax=Boeremia exigua TaxID=749465 RepID=A0ACC2IVA5_9PLEO|nr:hypothetical protein OPT61_g41 [Boeremia exigua]
MRKHLQAADLQHNRRLAPSLVVPKLQAVSESKAWHAACSNPEASETGCGCVGTQSNASVLHVDALCCSTEEDTAFLEIGNFGVSGNYLHLMVASAVGCNANKEARPHVSGHEASGLAATDVCLQAALHDSSRLCVGLGFVKPNQEESLVWCYVSSFAMLLRERSGDALVLGQTASRAILSRRVESTVQRGVGVGLVPTVEPPECGVEGLVRLRGSERRAARLGKQHQLSCQTYQAPETILSSAS